MGIFNEISQTVSGGPVGQTETNFDVVLSKYASKAQLDRVSRECLRKGQDLDMGGHKIIGLSPGAGNDHVPTIKQISDTFFPAIAHKDLNMNKKYIRGLETDLDDPNCAVNKKSLQQKIDIQKRDFAAADEGIKKGLQKELSDAETKLRNDLATKAAVATAKRELRQELASKAFVAAGEAELRKDVHNQYLRPIHLSQLENKIDAKISALPQPSGGPSGATEGYTKSEVDAKIQEVVNAAQHDDDYKRGLRRFVDKSARKKYEKKQAASFLARVKPGYYGRGEDVKVRWLSDDVYNNDDIEEDRDHWTLTLDPKEAAQHETLYLFAVHLVFRGSEEGGHTNQIQIKLQINQLGASKVVAFTKVRTENKDEITLFHVERIRNSATCSFVFNHGGYGGFDTVIKPSEKSRIAVVELQKPTHSLFRFLQSIGKDIQYSIRDYGSELDFSEQSVRVITVDSARVEFRTIRERDIIGLSHKKIIASIDIELNGKTCYIECYTWNDFASELRSYPDLTNVIKWKREYSEALSDGTQEAEFQMGYVAKYVLFAVRGDEGYRVRKFTLTPDEQYQHVYLSPPVSTLPIDKYTYNYSLGGLFGMSTYPIAPRVTPIPIGLPDNDLTRYDEKRPFEIKGKLLHSPGNEFQQWIKFKKRCTPTFTLRLCTGGEIGATPPYISCYKKGRTPVASTEILETRKAISFSGQNEVEMSQTFERDDEIFFGAMAPSGILWLVSPMSSVNVIEVEIKFEGVP